MKRLLKVLLWTFVVFVVAIGGLFVHVWYFKPARIDWFYGRVFAKFAVRNPEMLSSMRVLPPWADFYSDDFADASLAEEKRAMDLLKESLATLKSYDRESLTSDGKLSYDVLEYFLRIQVEGEAFAGYEFPVNQMQGIQSALADFMTDQHPVASESEARDYVTRLTKFPLKFDQVIEGLALREQKAVIPPRFTVEKVLTQMRGFIEKPAKENTLYTTFKDKLDKIPAEAMSTATREELLGQVEKAIQDSVFPAYRKMIAHYEGVLPKAEGNYGAWHLPNGEAYYAWCVRQHTTTTMTPDEIHQIGLSEVARISGEMNAILVDRGMSEGTIGDRVRMLTNAPEQLFPNTPEGKQELLAHFQAIIDDINGKLDSAFDVRPKLGVEVKPVPEYAQATAPGAYYQPGSFDGSRPGQFYANLRNVAEMPKFTMRTLAYHEAIPGHHFQIAIAQELQGVPFFRRVLPFTAYSEGWALYTERLAYEMGFHKDPLDNLGRLRDEMMRAVRLVVDTGIHSKQWTREQAIAYMLENTGMVETDVVAEIERYFVMPGQALGYKVGMIKMLDLREKARKELGEKFDIKQFHNQVLTHGALPMVLLERVIDDWIAATKKA
ncbi:DUF885 domain-containing protein [Tahibacter amnicola]|uniref:DUF885 domain-containing protein n=1 Tax=Tahibacter amnicola TaxID=2976241 RepID=A0ABY6BJL3_9GAMM|nr:DUF885 domain-containing protein [Tahibacter amnicola]UXI69568.1 DUF885 domain-containing protein [Tahibacter amnicola]